MLNYYQPYLLPFLGIKRYTLPPGVKQFYYHSMEDALWEFLQQKNIAKGSLFLLPNFYCVDVLNNFKRHGYNYKLWKLDKQFHTNIKEFKELLKKTNPKIIFIFHPAGITSNLMFDTSWLQYLPPDCYIIEDSVHRLVNVSAVKLLHKRHVIMDSLRKVSPLPGSFVYGFPETISYKQSSFKVTKYFLISSILYLIFRFILQLGIFFNSAMLTDFAHQKILQKHDDLIGDTWETHAGVPWIPFIHKFVNFEKVENNKRSQIILYKKIMKNIYLSNKLKNIFYEIKIDESDYKNMHVYPVGVNLGENKTKHLISYLHNKNISVWIKFPGCSWNSNKACLFMPLGFHVSDKEIEYAVNILEDFITNL